MTSKRPPLLVPQFLFQTAFAPVKQNLCLYQLSLAWSRDSKTYFTPNLLTSFSPASCVHVPRRQQGAQQYSIRGGHKKKGRIKAWEESSCLGDWEPRARRVSPGPHPTRPFLQSSLDHHRHGEPLSLPIPSHPGTSSDFCRLHPKEGGPTERDTVHPSAPPLWPQPLSRVSLRASCHAFHLQLSLPPNCGLYFCSLCCYTVPGSPELVLHFLFLCFQGFAYRFVCQEALPSPAPTLTR